MAIKKLGLCIILLAGLFYIIMLAPFMGYDEGDHYSSIRQIADVATLPAYGKSHLAKEVCETPAYYNCASALNREAQHPPLYYLMLAPVEKISESAGIGAQVVILRIISFLMALFGACWIACYKNPASKNVPDRNSIIFGLLLYPILFPGAVLEFARIGNDSLCLLIVGAMAYLSAKLLAGTDDKRTALWLGAALAFGLLTKAFFIPIGAALVMHFLLWLSTSQSKTKTLASVILPAMIIGAGWYIRNFVVYGDFSGSEDTIKLAQNGGLIAGLNQHFTFDLFRQSLANTILTFIYYAYSKNIDWSSPAMILNLVSLITLAPLCLCGVALRIRQGLITSWECLTLTIFAFMSLGLLAHILVFIALGKFTETPGYYMHILIPFVGPALGMAIATLWQSTKRKIRLAALLFIGTIFAPALKLAIGLYEFSCGQPNGSYFALAAILIVGLVGLRAKQNNEWPSLTALLKS